MTEGKIGRIWRDQKLAGNWPRSRNLVWLSSAIWVAVVVIDVDENAWVVGLVLAGEADTVPVAVERTSAGDTDPKRLYQYPIHIMLDHWTGMRLGLTEHIPRKTGPRPPDGRCGGQATRRA